MSVPAFARGHAHCILLKIRSNRTKADATHRLTLKGPLVFLRRL